MSTHRGGVDRRPVLSAIRLRCESAVSSQPAERRVRRNGHAFPDRARAKAPEDAPGAADVIGVAVGQHERVERAHAEGTQRARDDALADVEGRTVGGILERSGRQVRPHRRGRRDDPGARATSHRPARHPERRYRSQPRGGSATPSRVAACGATTISEAEKRGHGRGGARRARGQQRQDERAVVRGQHTPGWRRELAREPGRKVDESCRIDQTARGEVHDVAAGSGEVGVDEPGPKRRERAGLNDGHQRDRGEVQEQGLRRSRDRTARHRSAPGRSRPRLSPPRSSRPRSASRRTRTSGDRQPPARPARRERATGLVVGIRAARRHRLPASARRQPRDANQDAQASRQTTGESRDRTRPSARSTGRASPRRRGC